MNRSNLAEYHVGNISTMRTRRGLWWQTTIFNGQGHVVCYVTNEGNGGCLWYSETSTIFNDILSLCRSILGDEEALDYVVTCCETGDSLLLGLERWEEQIKSTT